MIKFYNRDSEEISQAEWQSLLVADDYRVVKQDLSEDGRIAVSTVWLGMDQSWGLSPKPLIFETLVLFPHKEDLDNGIRASTEEQARFNHGAFVLEYLGEYAAAKKLIDGAL